MGRLLTDREIDRLSRLTQSWLTVHSLDRRPDPAVPPEILSQLGAREGIAVRPEDRKWIGGYALMKDLSGKPALVLRVMVDRLIDRQGRFMVLYLMAALVLIGVAFGLSNLLLLKRSVLQPLQGIVADVEAISGRGAFSERVSASARGEMAGLASAVNGLLDRLDDTQRKLMTESARYRAIVDYQSEFICRFLSDGTITFVNDALCRFVDRPRDEIVGDSILSLIGPEAQDQLRSQMRLLTPESPNIALDEFPLVLSDGRVRWLLWNARAIFDAEGRLQEYQAAARDITKDKAFLEEYQRSVEGVRQAKIEWEGSVDALEELIFLVDDRTCVVRANRTLEAWSLGRVEAGIGRPLHELLHPGCADAACGLEAFLNEALGRIPVGETVHREFDDPQIGKVIDVRLRTVFLKSDGMDEARSDLSVVVIQDISARRKAEKALLAVNEKLAEANRQLGLAYAWMRDKKDELKQRIFHEEMAVLLNSEGRIEGVSDKVVECLEQSRDGLIGRKMLDLIREGFREDFSWELRQAWMGMAQDIPIGFADVKRCAGIFEAKLTRLTLSGVRLVLMTMR